MKQNPKVEWGFFAITPRIVRTQYKDLSHTEKWLYVCLKDLCGDKGVCYRTLKVLAQETDLSTGNLSTGIRRLHDAGLIHAEKKRRSLNPTAKEVWHISIVDIWQSNVEYCSNFERCEENVQEMNVNVQNLNDPPLERSISEQQRSNFDDRRITPEEQHIEERTVEEERENAFAVAQSSPTEIPPEEDFHFYGTEQQHLTWNCRNWCAGNHGTCEDYVAAIAAGLHERTTDKMPVVPPGNVTPVSCSQPVYKQEMAKHNVTDATSLEGETNGHLPATAHPDVGSTRTERAMGGTEQGTIDGHVAPIEQTVSGLFPGAVPARHGGQASDGAASTASPRSEPRASGKVRGKAPVEPVPISQDAVSILDDWDSVLKKPIPRTPKHVQAAVDLVPCHPSREDLKGCKGWLFTTDNPQKPWFRKKGVTLQDVRDNYGAWQSVQPTEPAEDELEPYSIPWFLAQQARRQAQELQA